MTRHLQNFIHGQSVASTSARRGDLVNPATGEVFASADVSGSQDVERAFDSSHRAFADWSRTTPAVRQRALLDLADAVQAHAETFTALETENTGKPIATWQDWELSVATDNLRFFAGAARQLEGKSAGEYQKDFTSFVRREPVGVIGQITPWNFPLNMAVWKMAPAIAAGNTCVLKPSETTPSSTLLLAQLAAEILPAGVFNVVLGDRDTGSAMVTSPVPQMISITGSVRAGTEVAQSAGGDLKRLHLELGGKAPVVVFSDVNVAVAAEGIALAGFYNAGQDCTSATRVLVHDTIHDEFVTALLAATRRCIVVGPPQDPNAYCGPLNSAAQLNTVTGFIDRLPAHANIETGGARIGSSGFFFEPTVVTGLHQGDEAVQHEIFGPVITVQAFRTEAEALQMANDTRYGLASSVWTENHRRAMRFARDLDAGCVWINAHLPLVAEMPQGGFKRSGYGKDLSSYALEEYTRIKHVMSFLGDADASWAGYAVPERFLAPGEHESG